MSNLFEFNNMGCNFVPTNVISSNPNEKLFFCP